MIEQRSRLRSTQPPTFVAYPHPLPAGWLDTVFLHGRTARQCPERLVVVGVFVDHPGARVPKDGIVLTSFVQQLATWKIGSIQQGLRMSELRLMTDRIYAGQPDPADDSHFTIRYDLNGKSDTIDGRLRADDTIDLVPRKQFK